MISSFSSLTIVPCSVHVISSFMYKHYFSNFKLTLLMLSYNVYSSFYLFLPYNLACFVLGIFFLTIFFQLTFFILNGVKL